MKKGIEWQLFPKNLSCPDHLKEVIIVFEKQLEDIDSLSHELKSNDVLACIADGLVSLGYDVETSKNQKTGFLSLFCLEKTESLKSILMPMPIVMN